MSRGESTGATDLMPCTGEMQDEANVRQKVNVLCHDRNGFGQCFERDNVARGSSGSWIRAPVILASAPKPDPMWIAAKPQNDHRGWGRRSNVPRLIVRSTNSRTQRRSSSWSVATTVWSTPELGCRVTADNGIVEVHEDEDKGLEDRWCHRSSGSYKGVCPREELFCGLRVDCSELGMPLTSNFRQEEIVALGDAGGVVCHVKAVYNEGECSDCRSCRRSVTTQWVASIASQGTSVVINGIL